MDDGREVQDEVARLTACAAGPRGPESGVAAAATVALAARVVVAASDSGADRAQAQALLDRAVRMAAGNVVAHAAAREVLAGRTPASPDVLRNAGLIPIGIAATAADVAVLAREVAQGAGARVLPDLAGAAHLAAGAAGAAAGLVAANLVLADDTLLLETVRREVDRARSAAAEAPA